MRMLGLLAALALGVGASGFVPVRPSCTAAAAARRQQLHSKRRHDGTVVMEAARSGRQQHQQRTRKDVLLQGMLGLTAGALALGSAPAPSNAWCGRPYPSWAYRIPFNDGNFKLRITGLPKLTDVFLRVVGKDKSGVPPIIVIPTVGLAHDYLETLEALSYGDRQVITFDPVGVGQSSRELPAGLGGADGADVSEEEALGRWSAMVVEVVKGVIEFLELQGTDVHLLGHGAGAIPALQYAAELAAGGASVGAVKSLTLADPFVLGGKAWSKGYTAAGQTVPLCMSEAVDGFGKVPAMAKAEEARAGAPVFDARWVSAPEFDKLAGVPTFISYGGSNAAITEKEAQRVAARVPAGTQAVVKRFEGTALPHVDQYEAYTDWLDELLQRAEGKMRPV